MLVTGNISTRTRSRTDPLANHQSRLKGSARSRQVTLTKAVVFRARPRDVFFSVDESRPRGELQVIRTRPISRRYTDPMQEYFPSASSNHASTLQFEPVSSGAQSRCESVPLPTAAGVSNLESDDADTTRSVTAPPNVDLSLELSDFANLNMKADDVATVAIEKEQRTFNAERRLNISSAMGVRQHGSPRIGDLSGTPRRKRLDREQAYLAMKFRERPCLRTESFLNNDLYDKVNNMSRECCDVLGPRACHECDRLNRRSNSALCNEANFPSIHISAANFSTMTLVNRARPELNSRQVLETLAHGDVFRQSIRRKNRTEQRRASDAEDCPQAARKTSVSAFRVPDGLGFFTNFTDLRAQIFAQKQGQKHGNRTKRSNQGAGDVNNLPVITDVELIPKKDWERENPANYFGPPMLSRAEIQRQQSQPRFYAGTQGKYELPEAPSFDEIAFKATGARHQRLREREARSDTPDSDVPLWGLKPSRNDDGKALGESKMETNADEEIVSEAGTGQNVIDLDS